MMQRFWGRSSWPLWMFLLLAPSAAFTSSPARADLHPAWTVRTRLRGFQRTQVVEDPVWTTDDTVVLDGTVALDRKSGAVLWDRYVSHMPHDITGPNLKWESYHMAGLASIRGKEAAILVHEVEPSPNVQTGASPDSPEMEATRSLVAVDLRSGAPTWTVPLVIQSAHVPLDMGVYGSVIVVHAFLMHNDLQYFDAQTGRALDPESPPDRAVIESGAKTMQALQAEGAPHSGVGHLAVSPATHLFEQARVAEFYVSGNRHYSLWMHPTDDGLVGHSSWPGIWICTDRHGRTVWRATEPSSGGYAGVEPRPAAVLPPHLEICPEADIMLGSSDSELTLFDIPTRKPLWKHSLVSLAPSHLVVGEWLGNSLLCYTQSSDNQQHGLLLVDPVSRRVSPRIPLKEPITGMFRAGSSVMTARSVNTNSGDGWTDFSYWPAPAMTRKAHRAAMASHHDDRRTHTTRAAVLSIRPVTAPMWQALPQRPLVPLSACASGSKVLVSGFGGVTCFDRKTGMMQWSEGADLRQLLSAPGLIGQGLDGDTVIGVTGGTNPVAIVRMDPKAASITPGIPDAGQGYRVLEGISLRTGAREWTAWAPYAENFHADDSLFISGLQHGLGLFGSVVAVASNRADTDIVYLDAQTGRTLHPGVSEDRRTIAAVVSQFAIMQKRGGLLPGISDFVPDPSTGMYRLSPMSDSILLGSDGRHLMWRRDTYEKTEHMTQQRQYITCTDLAENPLWSSRPAASDFVQPASTVGISRPDVAPHVVSFNRRDGALLGFSDTKVRRYEVATGRVLWERSTTALQPFRQIQRAAPIAGGCALLAYTADGQRSAIAYVDDATGMMKILSSSSVFKLNMYPAAEDLVTWRRVLHHSALGYTPEISCWNLPDLIRRAGFRVPSTGN
jgi:hypothetical protein